MDDWKNKMTHMDTALKRSLFILLFLFVGMSNAYIIRSENYSVESIHQGLAGGIANSSNFTSRSTLVYQQPGNINGSGLFTFKTNVGWYNISYVVFFYNITTEMIYPKNGSVFGPNQCSFLGVPNITFSNTTNAVSVTCSLFLNGVFQNNKSVNLSSAGPVNITFHNLLIPGNYSMTCNGKRGIINYPNATAWANLWAMTGCFIQTGVTTTNRTTNITYVYTTINIDTPYIDVKTLFGGLLIGIAIFGMYHYINAMWQIRKRPDHF